MIDSTRVKSKSTDYKVQAHKIHYCFLNIVRQFDEIALRRKFRDLRQHWANLKLFHLNMKKSLDCHAFTCIYLVSIT